MTQFLRDQASDSEEVVTPLMLDGTYLSRNFATLGPLTSQPPCNNLGYVLMVGRLWLTAPKGKEFLERQVRYGPAWKIDMKSKDQNSIPFQHSGNFEIL